MPTPRAIALVTATVMPKPDLDTGLLVEALASRGHKVEVAAWDAPVEWAAHDLVVLRTPWDYARRVEDFLAWLKQTGETVRVLNPPELVVWNAHKRYLLELGAAGVPILPTMLLARGDLAAASAALASFGRKPVVGKPAVGVGAIGAVRGPADASATAAALTALVRDWDALIQPFAPEIETAGEVSLMFIAGAFVHAVRKRPKAGDFRVQDQYGGTVEDIEPTEPLMQAARKALGAAPHPPLYARVDLLERAEGPILMELEVIEPELFLRRSPRLLDAFVTAIETAAEQPKR